jgi:hypothetical protein
METLALSVEDRVFKLLRNLVELEATTGKNTLFSQRSQTKLTANDKAIPVNLL